MKALVMLTRPEDLNIVIQYLGKLEVQHIVIQNFEEGFIFWQQFKPELIIIDQSINPLKSREFIKTIRKNEYDVHTYILMIEENDESISMTKNECGVDDFMGRPFSKIEFSRRMYNANKTMSLVQQNLIVYALTRVFEARDKGTEGHLSRVSRLSKILIEGLDEKPKYQHMISQSFKEDLMASCQLHDIGKIGIEDVILKKPGQYTKDEFAIMKKHVIIGYDILKSIQQKYPLARFLNMALEIARHHHEKFDGTGYPDGLKGYDIPLSARIVGLADFYDALTSKRVYKRKYTHEEAKQLIIERRGSHFDPELVDVFLENEDSFKKISEGHEDKK